MKKGFEQRKASKWAEWERKLGVSIPEDFREIIEENLPVILGEEDITLKDLDGFIEDYRRIIEYLSLHRQKPKSSTAKEQYQRKKRYQRCFEKQLYLVEFVMWRCLTRAKRGRKSIYLRERFDWKQMCVEWNEAHPNDRMSKEVLKVRYYRAIAEEDIQREYIKRRFIRVPMNVGAEVYDLVRITDSEGNERIGHIDSIVRHFKNGKYSMAIRLLGDELSSEKSIQRNAKRRAQHERSHRKEGQE